MFAAGAIAPGFARGGDDVSGHLDSVAQSDGSFQYTVTLTNAGSDNIGTLWFAWVPGKSFLPTKPTNIQSPAGWTSKVTNDGPTDGYAIQWVTGATAPLKPGKSLAFAFDSTDAPAALQGNSATYPDYPAGTSIVYQGTPFSDAGVQFVVSTGPSSFFEGEDNLNDNVHYLTLPNGNIFGYYSYLSDDHYLYHQDLGYEYVFDAADGSQGIYLYDFASQTFFYTSPAFSFPYLYDFALGSVVYYYPDPDHAGRYNTDGVRYFYVFNTGEIISK